MNTGFAVGWRQVAIGFLLLGATGMIAATYSLIAVPLEKEFQPSRSTLMFSMTVLSGSCAILSPLLGNLMDRASLRWMMAIGGLCLACGFTAISMAQTFNQVLIVYAVLIAPANVLLGPVAVTVLLSRWFASRRGLALGIAIAGISGGNMVFPWIIQGLLDAHEWREALRLLALVLLIWTVPAALLVVNRPADHDLNPDGAAEPPAMAKAEEALPPVTVWSILSDPAFWMICVTVAVVTSGMKGMITNLALIAGDAGVTASTAATLIPIYAAGGFTSKAFFALLADRLGPRVLMYISLSGFAAGMACMTLAGGGYWMIALGVGMIGLFGGLMVPTESYLAPRVFGQRAVGRAMGMIAGTILIALLATPWLFGKVFDLTGSYTGMFWVFVGLALLTLLVVPFIRLTPREVVIKDSHRTG